MDNPESQQDALNLCRPGSPELEQIQVFLEERLIAHQVPGAAVGVLANGTAHVFTAGVTSVENPLPVTADTLFQIGSVTKTLTAAAILRLAEMKELCLDEPVRSYLPDLALWSDATAREMTVRHLLTHSSGLEGDWCVDCGDGYDALANFTHRLHELRLVAPPGRYFSYSNPGFLLAGRVLEVIARRPYEHAIRDLLLAPLGMSRSCFHPAEVMTQRFAVGHVDRHGEPSTARPWHIGRTHHASGGLTCPISDLLRWARCHLADQATSDGAPVLSLAGRRSMREKCLDSVPFHQWIGMPWSLDDRGGVAVVSHGGVTHGQVASLVLAPARALAVAVLTNAAGGGALASEVTEHILTRAVGMAASAQTLPEPVAIPDQLLQQYRGVYGSRQTTFTIVPKGDSRLSVDVEVRGYPMEDAAPLRYPTEMWAFAQPDQAFQEFPPRPGSVRTLFIRDGEGRVAYVRSSRLYPRIGSGGSPA